MSSPNKPQYPNNKSSGKQNQGQPPKPAKKRRQEDRKPLPPRLENSAEVPVMFRAQIQEAHGSLQFAGKVKDSEGNEKHEDIAEDWVQEWLKPWKISDLSAKTVEKPKPKQPMLSSIATTRPSKTKPQELTSTEAIYELKIPEWGSHIRSWSYQVSWRLVTNSGQEPDFICPVLGARGVPFYPGSSMKGAFAQACTDEQRNKYCGQLIPENGVVKTKPGCLRFHGGYPVDTSWANQKTLVDVIHPQQNRQVEKEEKTGAKKQISLFQTVISFGFSSTDSNLDWDEVRGIWEKALMNGLGGRTSAGYGQVAYRIEGKKKILLTETREPLLSIHLSGQGITSQLLNKQPEFRPNMFKAGLRGHTLRLFSGITDQKNAKLATAYLWGEIDKDIVGKEAIVGHLSIQFSEESSITQLKKTNHNYKETSLYSLTGGKLEFHYQSKKLPVPQGLSEIAESLLQFTILLSGFGKSWRRIDHSKFSYETSLPKYVRSQDKAPIGCHWEFHQKSHGFYLNTADWENSIRNFLNGVYQQFTNWLLQQNLTPNGYEKTWRESWHPENVQIWGRLAKNEKDSLAISWFHGDYTLNQTIKGTFAGKIGKIGRVWHRMYPQYIQVNGEWQKTGKYIEILTIFPRFQNNRDRDKLVAEQFVRFLETNQDFTKLWGN